MKKFFTLLSTFAISGIAFAQIPNPGFETWTSVAAGTPPSIAYHRPTGWDNPNATTSALGVATCDSGMDAPPQGLAYIKLETKTVIGIGAVPGVAVTGQIVISGTSYTVKGGFPNTTRPANLTGKWQHMASGSSDHARLGAYLWKWNTALNKRDTVAIADTVLTGMAMSWANFSIPIKYFSGATPDSALIILSSSATTTSVTAGSYLWVDDLAFAGTIPSGVVTIAAPNALSAIFPNPASGMATVYYHSTTTKDIVINISDINGRVIKTMSPRAVRGENNFTLNLIGLAQGIYFVQIVDENGMQQTKLMVE